MHFEKLFELLRVFEFIFENQGPITDVLRGKTPEGRKSRDTVPLMYMQVKRIEVQPDFLLEGQNKAEEIRYIGKEELFKMTVTRLHVPIHTQCRTYCQ
jgi:hypothetical protein